MSDDERFMAIALKEANTCATRSSTRPACYGTSA